MEGVEFKYVEINTNSCIISKMVAKMIVENLNLMCLRSAFIYKDKWSVYSYEVKEVELKYVEINNNSYLFSKMAAKMAVENLNLMYLRSAFRYKDKWSVYSYEVKEVQYEYVEINNNSGIIFKMAAKMTAENLSLIYHSFAF